MRNLSVEAKPFAFDFDLEKTALVIIDMQRDFCEFGGFGEALGNDITPTKAIIPTVKTILDAAREKKMFIVHTREGHRPDLSDVPKAKKRKSPAIGEDGPTAFDPRDQEAAIRMINQQGGIFGWTTTSEALLKGLNNKK